MQNYFLTHLFQVYFVYGLSFFLLGFAITLEVRRYLNDSQLSLGRFLWLLAAFGLAHGLAEWSTMFRMQDQQLPEVAIGIFNLIDNILMALSFLFLYLFGVWLTVEKIPRLSWLKFIPFISFLGWIGVVIYTVSQCDLTSSTWIGASRVTLRFFLAFPGGMFSAFALYLQYKELKTQVSKMVSKNFLIAAWVMAGYAVLAGLIVRKQPFSTAFLLKEDIFLKLFGVPVHFARAICGILLAYFIIKGLDVFHEESQQRLEQVEKEKLLYQERGRISRDLHDGIIQSIYGVGLNLENVSYLIDESPAEAKIQINKNMTDLNNIVKNIRQYILGLRPSNFEETDLVKGTKAFFKKFKVDTLVHVDFTLQGQPRKSLTPQQCNNYYHILQEILNNITKHARATMVETTLAFKEDAIELVVWDNGLGFEYEKVSSQNQEQDEKQGLKNLQVRADLLGGTIKIKSWPNKGTILRLHIPEGA